MTKAKNLAQRERIRHPKNLKNRKQTFVTFIDFAKASDSVNRELLIEKLRDKNISHYLVATIDNFLF